MLFHGNLSKKKRRISVVLNIAAPLLIAILFELIRINTGFNTTAGIMILGLLLLILILTFMVVFGSTGTWKMSHQKIISLDERQIQVVLTRISYSLFVILVPILIYGFALMEKDPIEVVMAAALLYLAYLLPASILAWIEKEIYS